MTLHKSKFAYIDDVNKLCIMEQERSFNVRSHQVLVKVEACGLLLRKESYRTTGTSSMRTEIVGRVIYRGAEVTSFDVGDTVVAIIAHTEALAGCRGHLVFAEHEIVHVPPSVSATDVVSSIGDLLQSYIALFFNAKLKTSDSVLILNGANCPSNICLQLAVHVGFRVITTVRSQDEKMLLAGMSLTIDVIDLSEISDTILVSRKLYDECMRVTEDLGVDAIIQLDSVPENEKFGHHFSVEMLISCLSINGKWVCSNSHLELNPLQWRNLYERSASVCLANEKAWLLSQIAQGTYQTILRDAINKLELHHVSSGFQVSGMFAASSLLFRPREYDTSELEELPSKYNEQLELKTSRIVVKIS